VIVLNQREMCQKQIGYLSNNIVITSFTKKLRFRRMEISLHVKVKVLEYILYIPYYSETLLNKSPL